jgi:hypothetical protein
MYNRISFFSTTGGSSPPVILCISGWRSVIVVVLLESLIMVIGHRIGHEKNNGDEPHIFFGGVMKGAPWA